MSNSKRRKGRKIKAAAKTLASARIPLAAKTDRNDYYPFLDGFRALAIFIILVHHMRRNLDLDNLFATSPTLQWICRNMKEVFNIDLSGFYDRLQEDIWKMKGVLGVEMFFVISGFLITRILLKENNGRISIRQFYLRRFFKIYPVYAATIFTSLAVFFFLNHAQFREIIATFGRYLFFFQNYYLRNPLLEHTWSLVVIEQFYLVCPLAILGVYALIKSPAVRRGVLIAACLLIISIAPFIRICYLTTGHPPLEWPFQAPFPFLTTLFHLGPIAFGCLLALMEPFWSRWRRNLAWGWFFWIIGATLFIHLSFNKYWDYFVGEWYLYTLGWLSVGCLVIAAFHGVSLVVRVRQIQWLGRHSYGIYLWHYLPLYFWASWMGKIPPLLIILAFLSSSVVLGVLSTKTIERYFLSLRESLVPKNGFVPVRK